MIYSMDRNLPRQPMPQSRASVQSPSRSLSPTPPPPTTQPASSSNTLTRTPPRVSDNSGAVKHVKAEQGKKKKIKQQISSPLQLTSTSVHVAGRPSTRREHRLIGSHVTEGPQAREGAGGKESSEREEEKVVTTETDQEEALQHVSYSNYMYMYVHYITCAIYMYMTESSQN